MFMKRQILPFGLVFGLGACAAYLLLASEKPRPEIQSGHVTEMPKKFVKKHAAEGLTFSRTESVDKELFARLFKEAEVAANQGQWLEVERLGKILLEAPVHDVSPYFLMAAVSMNQYENPAMTAEWYLKGLVRFPNDQDLSDFALETLRSAQLKLEDLDAAVVQDLKGFGEQVRFLAQKAWEQGDLPQAIELKKKYIEQRQIKITNEYHDLGKILIQSGSYEDGMQYFRYSRDYRILYPTENTSKTEQIAFVRDYVSMVKKYGEVAELEAYLEQLKKSPENGELVEELLKTAQKENLTLKASS